jgi:hypothetical protein
LNIDSGLFQLKFNPPQNFAAYRQSELDNARVGTFASMEAFPYISKRFALERFLGLTEEEITKNEELWREENNKTEDEVPAGQDLRNIGVSVGDVEADEQTGEEMAEPEAPEGEEMAPEIGGPVQSSPGAMPPAGPEA